LGEKYHEIEGKKGGTILFHSQMVVNEGSGQRLGKMTGQEQGDSEAFLGERIF